MKKISTLFSVLIPLLAVMLIILTVYLVAPDFSRADLYNLAMSLLVILISGVSIFAVLKYSKPYKNNKE